jgi:hypothetical protein
MVPEIPHWVRGVAPLACKMVEAAGIEPAS